MTKRIKIIFGGVILALFSPIIAFAKGAATWFGVIFTVIKVAVLIIVTVIVPNPYTFALSVAMTVASVAGAALCATGNDSPFFNGCSRSSSSSGGGTSGAGGSGTNTVLSPSSCQPGCLPAGALCGVTSGGRNCNSFNNCGSCCSGSARVTGSRQCSGAPRYDYACDPVPAGLWCPYGGASGAGGGGGGGIPSCSFSANPSALNSPQSVQLSWNCGGANTCSIDQGIGSVNTQSGSKTVTPSKTTTYNLKCDGSAGSKSFPATINVNFSAKYQEVIPR